MSKGILKSILRLPRHVVAFLVRVYQKTLSPDHGLFKCFFPNGYCKFEPSCSEFCRMAFLKYGVFRGGAKSLWRFLRCNPWNNGGKDEP